MTKNDFREWKQLEITQVILAKFHQLEEDAKEKLASSAGLDPLEDRRMCGYIAALRDCIYTEFEDTE